MVEQILKKEISSNSLVGFFVKVWNWNFALPKQGIVKIGLIFAGVVGWLMWQPQIQNIMGFWQAESVEVFYMVDGLVGNNLSKELYFWLALIAVTKVIWGCLIGLADLAYFKKITGRSFDYANMINMVVVNSLILFAGVFSYSYFTLSDFFEFYDTLLVSIPTLIHLNGFVAFLLAMLIGDFCFYWAHRMIHNVRVFWNLGHIYHHRNENLSQLTHGVEPRLFLLNAQGIASLLFLPVLAKIFTNDFSDASYFLIPMALINLWIDPSHSVALYAVESKFKPLRLLRVIFMTTCAHYTHHSKDPAHNRRTGCNFGSRLTIWDRLFNTYVEPGEHIPESGLFGSKTDYCLNPVRFLLLPYLRFLDEFKLNKIRYWPRILFGSVFWAPPKKSKLSH
jgi:sterol desaturase/sphingolipid hydroxylase (fatty acid hydroxylase superfamily)